MKLFSINTVYKLIIMLSVSCFFSQEGNEYIIGVYEYESLGPQSSKINVGQLVINDDTPMTSQQNERIRYRDSLIANDPRYSKHYLKFTKTSTTEYLSGRGFKMNSKNTPQTLYKGKYPILSIIKKSGDTIIVYDSQFRKKARLIKTDDDISNFEVLEGDQ